jgi:hypothetical protein
MPKLTQRTEESRIRQILAYALSGQRSFAACDIATREKIIRVTHRIMRTPEPRIVVV